MDLIPWDPWAELQRIREQSDRLLDEFLDKLTRVEAEPTRIAFLPDVDFVETAHEYRAYLSVPGLIEEDIDIAISPRSLVIRGERQPPYDPDHARRRLHEWRYGFFERRIDFPQPVRPETLRAGYEGGVLTILVAKA